MRFAILALAVGAACGGSALAQADDPGAEPRIEGSRVEGGARLLIGDRVAYEPGPVDLWIEQRVGDLILLGESAGGNLCPATFVWLRTTDLTATPPFGTCSDLATVSHDAETVTVSMPSSDAAEGQVDFVWDGKTPVREVVAGQRPSASPPDAGAAAWIGACAADLFRASDWREPLVSLMGEEAYAEAQTIIDLCEPMVAEAGWVVGTAVGNRTDPGPVVAVALSEADGRLLVAMASPEGEPRLRGDAGGALPHAIRDMMAWGAAHP